MGVNPLARVQLAQHLIGNRDWRMDLTGKVPAGQSGHSWNFEVVTKSPTSQLLIPFDFDLADWVRGVSAPIDLSATVAAFGGDVVLAEGAALKALAPSLEQLLQDFTPLVGDV